MRREVTLDSTHPQFVIELTFTPSSVIVLNNTDKSVYLSIGGTGVPSATFFDREILPTVAGIPANIVLPNNSYQFAGFLPTPTDTTKNVKVIFQGTADPYSNRLPPPFSAIRGGASGGGISALTNDLGARMMGGGHLLHYQEYRLNARNLRQVVELPWIADMIFILNNSDATLYFGEGGTIYPSSVYNDIGIPAKSYAILQPHGGWQYGMTLDSPSEKDCFVIYAFGYADEYAMLRQWGFNFPLLDQPWIHLFGTGTVTANFSFVVSP